MRTLRQLASLGLMVPIGLVASATVGCSVSPQSLVGSCTSTPFIQPSSVILDHTAVPPANSVQFITGVAQTGSTCPETYPPAALYYWQLSTSTAATITSPGGLATCTAAAAAPITVSSLVPTYSATGVIDGSLPSNLPSASLVCR